MLAMKAACVTSGNKSTSLFKSIHTSIYDLIHDSIGKVSLKNAEVCFWQGEQVWSNIHVHLANRPERREGRKLGRYHIIP
jgi:hypothetical protein